MKESVSCRYLAAEQNMLNTRFLIKESIYQNKALWSLFLPNKGKIEKEYIISMHFPISALIRYNAGKCFSL